MGEEPLFKNLDCLQLYVPDLQKGIEFYCNNLGLKILWKTDSAVGLGMANDIAEIVIQNEREQQEVDIKVDSVIDAVERIKKAGGEIVYGPFEIKIGKCAVVKDPWGNQYVILDATKGTFITDYGGVGPMAGLTIGSNSDWGGNRAAVCEVIYIIWKKRGVKPPTCCSNVS